MPSDAAVTMHRFGDPKNGQYVFNVGDEKYLATRTTWESVNIWEVHRFVDGLRIQSFTRLADVRKWAAREHARAASLSAREATDG